MRTWLGALLFVCACASEEPETETVSGSLTVSVVQRGSEWRYRDDGGDLGTSWRGEFDDASWSSGAGPLGFGESYVVTTLGQGPITHYFRHTFTVDDPDAVAGMVGEVMFDDGFVVYLNGLEIDRDAMPDGTVTASTPSTGHEIGNAYTRYDWADHVDLLVAGENTIAVEVHQVSEFSSDLVFDLALTIETGAPPPDDDGAWFYWDDGGDLGTAWRTLEGPAAGWETGEGPFGYGESYIETPIERNGVTAYFRHTFTVEDRWRVRNLLGQVMHDDGFVAYINGVEVQRVSMPDGTITAATLASGHEANQEHASYDWTNISLLRDGANVLAIEVHQASATSSDLVFDGRLTVETCCDPTPPPVIDSIPRESGWMYRDDGEDLGAAWRTLPGVADGWEVGQGVLGYGESYIDTDTETAPGVITTYFRRAFDIDDPAAVTSLVGEVMYDDGFVAYLNGVEIERAAMPPGEVSASTLSTGHEANQVYARFDWVAHRPLLVEGVNVLAFEVHQASTSSSDLVFDASLTVEGDAPPPPPPGDEVIAEIPRTEFWKYWDHGGSPDSPTWKTDTWPTDAWRSGYGPFGYGEDYVITTVSYGGDASDKHVTTYFWNNIRTHNPSAVTRIVAEVMYDDGFVLHLNGVEVARRAMPPGPVGSTTHSTGHEAGNAYESIDLSAHTHLLQPDDNIVTVEVHQADGSSSDLVFDMSLQLLGEEPPPPPPEEDIARGSVWRYWDRAESPSGDLDFWIGPDFNDAQWPSGPGPLGYGESYLATTLEPGPVTMYFRRWFTVEEASQETSMILELMYDDGVVVHLNGHEIVRRNMGEGGDPGHTTQATTSHEADNTYEAVDLTAFTGYLKRGANLLAVEVHNHGTASSDLVFDASLQLETPPVCAIPGGGTGRAPMPGTAIVDISVAPTTVYAVSGDAIGRRAADGAWCWSRFLPGTWWSGVWAIADDDVWFVGAEGRVAHFDGGGFQVVDAGATGWLTGVWASGPDDVWIVGEEGTIRHFDGASWQARDLSLDHDMEAVWGASPDDVWVTGVVPAPYPGNSNYDGTTALVYRWAPATGTWDLEFENTMYYGFTAFYALDGTSATDVWAVGADHPAGAACSYSGAYHYDGESWTGAAGAPIDCRSFRDVEAGAPGAEDGAWIVGGYERDRPGGAVRYTGGAWDEEVPAPDGFLGVDHEGDRMYACGRDFASSAHQYIVRWDGTGFVREW